MSEIREESRNPIDPARTEIVLAGRSFQWVEPGNRRRRELARAIAGIKGVNLGEGSIRISGIEALSVADGILDFFYQYHEGMKKEAEFLDDNATETEIFSAFARVSEIVFSPLARRVAEAEEISTATLPGTGD